MNKSAHLEMNFWTPTWDNWGHGRDPSSMPWFVYYDYIEVYSYDHNSKQFKLHWRDDFTSNSVDYNRWAVSDGATFDSNSSMFVKSHVYQKDGSLVFKMDKSKTEAIEMLLQ